MNRTRKLIAAVGIAALLAAGGATIATAQQDGGPPDLDGAAQAALDAAGDGDVTGVEQDDDGGYDVDVRHADGTETEVDLDASLQVVRTEDDADERDDAGDADEGALDEATRTRAADAALAAVGGGTVTEVEADDGGYDVEVRAADGTETDLHLDADLVVVTTETDAPDADDDDDD